MKFIKLVLFSLIIFCTQVVAQRDNIWMLGYGNSIISKPSSARVIDISFPNLLAPPVTNATLFFVFIIKII